MPCRMDDMPESSSSDKVRVLESQVKFLREQADKLTRLLCEIMTSIDKSYDEDGIESIGRTEEMRAWWKKHKTSDAKRKRIEAQKTLEAKERKEFLRLKKKYGKEKK